MTRFFAIAILTGANRIRSDVMATSEQEREFVAQLEERSIGQVKRQLERGEIPPAFVFVTSNWVSDKERQAEQRAEASNSEQIEIARSAAIEARRASDAAERQQQRQSDKQPKPSGQIPEPLSRSQSQSYPWS
jgi:hypothetical protein